MIAHDFLFLNWFFTIVFRAVGKKNKIREPVLLLSSSNGGESETIEKSESLFLSLPLSLFLSLSLFCLIGWLVGCFFLLFVLFFLYHMTASATVGKQKQYFHVQTKKSDIEGHKRTGVY